MGGPISRPSDGRPAANRPTSLPGMVRREPVRAILLAIALITALTGVVEIVAPGPVLGLLGADATSLANQLFATVGMFMVVVGGLVAHTLLRPAPDPDVVLWGGLQKFGAFVAVGLGVVSGTFAAIALLVAVFDLATAALLAYYWRRIRSTAPTAPGGRAGTAGPG